MYRGKFASESKPAKSKKGLILFLCFYAALVVAILVALCCLMKPLRQWLVEHEAAQLEHKRTQVFEQLFAEPDWKSLYELSGGEDTLYEGDAAYAAYMASKVGSNELTCQETDTDRSGAHKYNVLLGQEKVATFTLTGSDGSLTELPHWSLDAVEIFYERNINVTVEKKPGYTVYINGVALDDSFTIRSTATVAEEYLPEGAHGYRLEQQYIEGLLAEPEVLVLNESGEPVPVAPDAKTGIYTLQMPDGVEMTEAERLAARNAAVADAKFSMRGISATELKKYFVAASKVYSDIANNPMFIQSHQGFSVDESSIEVSEYCRYSNDLFSAKVKLKVKVIRKDKSVKVYDLDKTYFFTRDDQGAYLVNDYTNKSVQQKVEQIRLTFVLNDGQRISNMVNGQADAVTLPEISAPDGQKLVGWATRTDDGSGTVTMTVRLTPAGDVLGALEPMTLYPVFEAISDTD